MTEFSASRTLLFQGLKPRIGPASTPWQEIVRNRLALRFELIARGAASEAAEVGLGFAPSAYWFANRAPDLYGRVGAVWVLREAPADPTLGGCTPFDTGGVWSGKIKARPRFGRLDAPAFVLAHTEPLERLAVAFAAWVSSGYTDVGRYIDGHPPDRAGCRIVFDARQNDSVAWTWEARVEFASISESVLQPIALFISAADLEEASRWIEDADDGAFSTAERIGVLTRMRNIAYKTDDPVTDACEYFRSKLTAV